MIVMSPTIQAIMAEMVTKSVENFGPALRQIWLFGSQATGQATEDSDIDVAVVLEKPILDKSIKAWQLRDQVYGDFSMDILTRYGELLYVDIASQEEFADQDMPLYDNIKRKGVLVYDQQ